MQPLYILPPTRHLRTFAKTGTRTGAASPHAQTAEAAAALIAAYDVVRRRDVGSCQDCRRPYLAAPALRLWVRDRSKPLSAADNLELLCVRCCDRREAARCL